MIIFNSETDFELEHEEGVQAWLNEVAYAEGCAVSEINYVFCDDDYLLNLNRKFLDHDTLTDVIGFDNSIGKNLQGDIFISIERVRENASDFEVEFNHELMRVMVHGLLHFCGWSDDDQSLKMSMRKREDFHLQTAPLD